MLRNEELSYYAKERVSVITVGHRVNTHGHVEL